MASILDRYGIKEVADVTFYTINNNGGPDVPVLFLDTLKVSTIEQTAEQADARGGKGNPKLITWDYGKEITVTIEDALFSAKSMAIMFGNGTVSKTAASTGESILRSAMVRATSTALPSFFVADVNSNGSAVRKKIWMSAAAMPATGEYVQYGDSGITLLGVFKEDGTELKTGNTAITTASLWQSAAAVSGEKYLLKFNIMGIAKTITISGDTFPGTYYVQGDTYARSDVDGKDQFFQFIIPKCKMTAENTITLEADGDPSTFSMNLTVLRPEDGEMMKLVQYDIVNG